MRWHRALVFIAVLFASAGCDHVTKQLAHDVLAGSAAVSVVADTVRFQVVYNDGGFLSLGAGLPAEIRGLFFLVLVPFVLFLVCVLVLRTRALSRRSLVGLGLVAGGGLANWLDRLVHAGAVTDFVSVGLGGLRTGIFNGADVSVIAGALLLVLAVAEGGAEEKAA